MAKTKQPADAVDRYLANNSKPALQNPPTVIAPGTIPPAGTASVPSETGEPPNYGTGTPTATTTTTSSSGTFDPTALANDWYKAFFDSYGLPGDVQSEILRILTQYASDPSTAQALAQQYLRTTDWWQHAFPGFSQGVKNGLFTDETGYRSYLNAVNQIFNQYLGRHVTGDELSGYLASGYAPGYVGQLLQGQAWAKTNARDVRYTAGAFGDTGQLSDADLATLGNEKAGIDTSRGQSLDSMLARAQQRMQSILSGRLAAPSLSLGANGLSAPSLAGSKQTPDVSA